jgi:hypothetical protein
LFLHGQTWGKVARRWIHASECVLLCCGGAVCFMSRKRKYGSCWSPTEMFIPEDYPLMTSSLRYYQCTHHWLCCLFRPNPRFGQPSQQHTVLLTGVRMRRRAFRACLRQQTDRWHHWVLPPK